MAKKRKYEEQTETPAAGNASGFAAADAVQPSGGQKPSANDLPAELTAAQEEAAKNWDLYLRCRADLENVRKRAQREKEESARFGNENLLREILPVFDNLERAVSHARGAAGCDDSLLQGVEMTLGQFGKVLERSGVTPIVALGQPFDPSRHEAMGQVEAADVAPNTVAQELQKGYLLSERLLRPALVMISKAPAVTSHSEENLGT